MTDLAVAPSLRERFSFGVAASTTLHAALFAALLFGGALIHKETVSIGSPTANGGSVNVQLAGREGLLLPSRPAVKSNAPPSETPGDHLTGKTPTAADKPQTPKGRRTTTPTPPPGKNVNAIPLPGAKTNESEQPATAPEPAPSGGNRANNPVGTSGIPGNGSLADIQRGALGGGNGSGGFLFGDPSFGDSFPEYAQKLQNVIYEFFEPPEGTAGKTLDLRFTIAKDGSVSNVEVVRKSDVAALDSAARRAVTRAALEKRIPTLPPTYRRASLEVTCKFAP